MGSCRQCLSRRIKECSITLLPPFQIVDRFAFLGKMIYNLERRTSVCNLDQLHSPFPFEIRGSFVYTYIMSGGGRLCENNVAMVIMDYQLVKECGDILDCAFPV